MSIGSFAFAARWNVFVLSWRSAMEMGLVVRVLVFVLWL